jgi:hypothetical protein
METKPVREAEAEAEAEAVVAVAVDAGDVHCHCHHLQDAKRLVEVEAVVWW